MCFMEQEIKMLYIPYVNWGVEDFYRNSRRFYYI